MDKIKAQVIAGYDVDGVPVTIPVEEMELGDGKLGYLDRQTMKIAIHSDQPEAGKHLILLHEMIHAVVENMQGQGLCRRIPSESFVANLAGGLFGMLATSGMWVGVSPEEALEFMLSGTRETD
jgi:hypothetical protein